MCIRFSCCIINLTTGVDDIVERLDRLYPIHKESFHPKPLDPINTILRPQTWLIWKMHFMGTQSPRHTAGEKQGESPLTN